MKVEVAYALPERQTLLALEVRSGATVRDAIEASGVLDSHPEIDLEHNKVGIFGRTVSLEEGLRKGDRVEIYRPLIIDPKEVRKQRAEAARQKAAKSATGGSRSGGEPPS